MKAFPQDTLPGSVGAVPERAAYDNALADQKQQEVAALVNALGQLGGLQIDNKKNKTEEQEKAEERERLRRNLIEREAAEAMAPTWNTKVVV